MICDFIITAVSPNTVENQNREIQSNIHYSRTKNKNKWKHWVAFQCFDSQEYFIIYSFQDCFLNQCDKVILLLTVNWSFTQSSLTHSHSTIKVSTLELFSHFSPSHWQSLRGAAVTLTRCCPHGKWSSWADPTVPHPQCTCCQMSPLAQ